MKFLFVACIFLFSCTATRQVKIDQPEIHLNYLGKFELPHNLQFQGTTVGGLSSIDYNSKRDEYYLISDDRSSINPARFYTVKIEMNSHGIDTVKFVRVNFLFDDKAKTYPSLKKDPVHAPDPEAMRYDAKRKQLVWTSEGERIVNDKDTVLQDPSVIAITNDGKFKYSFPLPGNLHVHAFEKGPRRNGVFEGLSFMKNYSRFIVDVEEPLYEDGPRAGPGDSSGIIRMIEYDSKSRRPLAQYAYKIEPVAYPPNPSGSFKINGVPDIMAIDDHRLIVIERSFSNGRKTSTIKIFLADLNDAEDVANLSSIREGNVRLMKKKLLLNMDTLGIDVYNVEGITMGPLLADGHRSLVLVVDDNFAADEITQFFLMEIN